MGERDTTQLAKRVWEPVEQVAIPFYGHKLVAVRLEDGRIAAVLRWMCEGMGLHTKSQMQHIQGRRALAKGLVDVLVDTAGGIQEMPALTLDVMPGWLITVDERRVREEAREDVVHFQEEAVGVLSAHFFQKHAQSGALPAPERAVSVVEAALPAAPAALAPDASRAERIAYHDAMAAFLRWQQSMDEWRANADARQDAMEMRVDAIEGGVQSLQGRVNEIARVIPEIVQRFGEQPLSPAHQAAIQAGVTLIHDALDMPHATIYNELRRQFRVAKYDQIPDARWADVVAWFRPRVELALRQGGSGQADPFADDDALAQGRMF